MSSAGTSDTLKEESETVEQAEEENVKDETANGSEGGEDDEEEDDDEEDDDEKKEKSLIVEGKREKKKVERLCLEMSVVKKEPVLTEGKGEKLCDIERVQYFLKKKKCEQLRLLHRLLFSRPGTVNMIKKNIGQFNGFPFEKGSDQYKKKEDMLKKFKKDDLKNICGVLDLEKSGVNSELISRIMMFLMEPKSTGKPLPKSKSKPPKGGKKERSSSGSARKSKSRKSNVILTDESSSEEEKKDKEESSADEKESEEEVEDEEQEDEDEEPPKKVAKKEKARPKAASKGKKAAKSSNVKKADSSTTKSTSSSKKEKPVQSESEDDSSDDEPLIKKVNKPPTDDDLRETIKKLLAEADLEEVTMKQICKKVNESYPNCDLFSRKKFIKTTVKELIS
ncbi:protein DEK [Bufo gargarizans]|uniref:protein DEK n=1 Tax=Bufo gargarizans TaxID=30331 RepID=UPI001CF21371|nr:protein DEK [Bufo gargarizans]XP_044149642.1 protein DEK [Bufo gargarizans]